MTAQEEEHKQPSAPTLPPALAAAPRLDPPIPSEPELTPAPPLVFGELHSEFASFHEGYVRHYIALADTKAGVIFTLAAGVISYLIGKDDIQKILLAPSCAAPFVISIVALLLLGVAASLAFLVIAPRLAAPSNEGLVFFGAVAKRPTGDQYVHDIAASSEQEIVEARLRHCYDTARVCSRKYEFLKTAIWLTPIGLVFALTTVLLT